MGIKFYCPNGHKIHVKSFLAGKKGLCPKCGVRIEIPRESVKSEDAKAVEGSQSDDDADDEQEQEIATLPTATEKVDTPNPQAGVAGQTVPSGALVPPSVPVADDFRSQLPSPALGPANSESTYFPRIGQVASPPLPPTTAMWYVQLNNGQQFGPTDKTTLQQWIVEGRIGHHDLLWRDGWPNWDTAIAVFPQWPTQQAVVPGAAPAISNVADNPMAGAVRGVASPNTPGTWLRQRHRGKREIRATLSLVLLGLIVLLFALLLYVFFIRKEEPEAKQSQLPTRPFSQLRSKGMLASQTAFD
jgi:hypothetical protein